MAVHAQYFTKKGATNYSPNGDSNWREYLCFIYTTDSVWNDSTVDSIPEFKGKLNEWFFKNTNYPVQALDGGLQGRVDLTFDVEKDGSVSNVKILRHVSIYLDTAALNAAEKMPKWKPGFRNGKKVKTGMVLSVRFKIRDWQTHSIHKPLELDSVQINNRVQIVH